MTDSALEVIKTIAWCAATITAINVVGFCYVVRMFVTGRPMFQRKYDETEHVRPFVNAR